MKKMSVIICVILGILLIAFPIIAQEEVDLTVDELVWEPPTTGGEVEGYNVRVSETSGVYDDEPTDMTTETSIPLADLDLSEGKIYYAVIDAYNSAGIGPYSNEVSFIDSSSEDPTDPTT